MFVGVRGLKVSAPLGNLKDKGQQLMILAAVVDLGTIGQCTDLVNAQAGLFTYFAAQRFSDQFASFDPATRQDPVGLRIARALLLHEQDLILPADNRCHNVVNGLLHRQGSKYTRVDPYMLCTHANA
jgi:hypothetical protein